MPWFNVWDGLKNKTCRYLLQRYLGQFLEEKLNLEQLNVELYHGRATVKNVSLKVETLNELFEAQGWSVEVTGGRIGLITVTVPWNALMTNDSSIEISDLFICLRPVKRQNNGTSMLESMWSSVSSSLQLAQECMKQTDNEYDSELGSHQESIDGLEKFAETIDNVLNRIKAKCTNVVLRLEYVSEGCVHGIAIVIKINNLNYRNDAENNKNDETGSVNDRENFNENENMFDKNIHKLSTFTTHNISLKDVYIYTEEFKVPCDSTFSCEKSCSEDFNDNDKFCSVTSELSSFDIKNRDIEEQDLPQPESSGGKTCHKEKECESIPIPILKIEGQQKILLKMKQSEEINGPKVILDIELGALCLIVTPRQIHILLKFYELFCDDRSCAASSGNACDVAPLLKTMEYSHNKNYRTNMTGSLGIQNIWSETREHEFIPSIGSITQKPKHKFDFKYCESVSSSMSSSSNVTSSSRFQRKMANMDICGDISKFNIKIATILAILLQEDLLVENNLKVYNCPLNEKSQHDMVKIAEQCFFTFSTEYKDRLFGRTTKMCNKNHILLQLTPIIADGMQQRNRSTLHSKMIITAAKIDLYEVLEDKAISLIDFHREDNSARGYNQRPELSISIQSTSPFNIKRQDSAPKTVFDINLEHCVIEFDISIYDRLSAIIRPSPFKKPFLSRQKNQQEITSEPYEEIKLSSEKIGIKLRFPIGDVRPIHDPERVPFWKQNIRPDFLLLTFEKIRLSYGIESIEITANEINAFYCEDSLETRTHLLKVVTACDSSTAGKSTFEIPKIIITTPKENGTGILSEASGCESSDTGSSILGTRLPFSAKRVCRQSDTIHTKHEAAEESETFLLPGETREIKKFCDSTMKSSKVVIKVNIPVASIQLQSKQLYEIIYNRLNSDIFMWQPSSTTFKKSMEYQTVPEMKQSILNVGLFDSLYVPSSTTRHNSVETSENYEHKKMFYTQSKKAAGLSSSVESVADDELKCGSEMYLSDHDVVSSSIYVSTQETNNDEETYAYTTLATEKRSECSVELSIGKIELTLLMPTRDTEKRVLPGQLGKIIARLKAVSIFFVNGYNGSKNLSYLCLNLKNLEAFHCGLIPVDVPISINMDSEIPSYMQSTFYKTPKRLTKGGPTAGCNKREMVSLVIEIKKIPEQKIKRLKITTGIQKTTLRHNPAPPPQTWLSQLIDFLNVTDYPISGYEPYGIVSEMQLHLWDCAIDYRPKNFAYRSVVEIGTFNISSNIISSITGCTLRFVAEECILSIAPFDNKKNAYPDNQITNLPSSDLVPTLDVGLLDISLRISDKSTGKCPKLDLRALIKDVHLRTCADSGSALAQLIAYLANDGDIPACNDDGSIPSSIFSSIQSSTGLLEVTDKKSSSTEISEEQQERVNKLMAEAVIEPVRSLEACGGVSARISGTQGIEVFYFPDEDSQSSKQHQDSSSSEINEELDASKPFSANTQECDISELSEIMNFEANVMSNSYSVTNNKVMEALPQIKKDLGDISIRRSNQVLEDDIASEKDDDYCLIAEEEKSYMSNFGIKSLNLSDEPLRIVDNHFCLPTGKPDLLKSPENFPMAVQRYTLCEMSFTWHLYGGNDFPLNEVAAKQSGFKASDYDTNKEKRTKMSEAYKHGVSYSKGTDAIQYGKKQKEKLTWKTSGGHNRNHEVLVEIQFSKVSLSHEVYPTHTSQASRQVLVINEIEIRDRLQTSDINKFLYHPRSIDLPNKSNPNMFVIKALQVRPNTKINHSQECSLRISLLPLRLHIDQDTLLFLVEFFTNLGDRVNNEAVQSEISNENSSTQAINETQAPVMVVDDIPEAVQDLHARRMVSTNLDLLMEENTQKEFISPSNDEDDISGREESTPIYFREVVFSPEVQIRFDYHGHRVELSRGPVAGLLMGLGQLQCSEIKLRKITYRRGLLGIEKLITYMCKEWLKDIKKNQLPNILSGVGPTYAFIQLFQGIYDLFWLPIEQFQKDGRIIRGLQLGAQSFTARTALAALEITSRIIQLLQFTAETAFDMVSPGPTVRPRNLRKGKRKRPHRPKDILEGVTNAYTILKEGFNDSAQTLIDTAVAEHDQRGYTGAVGAVMRQIPQLVVCPAVLATQATTNILGGVKSSLVPEAKLEARDKWKDDTD